MKPPFYETGVSSSSLHIHDGTDDPYIGLTPNSSKDNKKSIAQEGILGAYGKVASDSKSSFTPPDLSLTDTKSPSKVSMANSGAKTGTTDFANVESRKSSDTKITGRGLLEAASYAPGIGTAAQAGIVGSELSQGNFKDAAMASIFLIPGARLLKGAGKLIKSGMKAFSKPSIANQAKNLIKTRNATLAKGNVIQEGDLGYKTAQSMSNARKQAQNKIDFNNPIDEVNLKTNAIKEPKLTLDSVFEAPFSKNPTISTRTGPGVVENVKLTPESARKQFDEQLKKMKKK